MDFLLSWLLLTSSSDAAGTSPTLCLIINSFDTDTGKNNINCMFISAQMCKVLGITQIVVVTG